MQALVSVPAAEQAVPGVDAHGAVNKASSISMSSGNVVPNLPDLPFRDPSGRKPGSCPYQNWYVPYLVLLVRVLM